MSMTNYTSLHDIKDIVNIYHDCPDYAVRFWNFADYRHLHVWSNGSVKHDCSPAEIILCAAKDCPAWIEICTVNDLKEIVKAYDDQVSDDAKIVVWNRDNNHPMHINFTGSSNVDREVHYNIEYDDDYHAWKGRLRLRCITILYKLKNLFI